MKDQQPLPAGWDEQRVKQVLEHYEQQSEADAIAEDDAAFEGERSTIIKVPVALIPMIRELLAKHSSTS